MANDVTILPDCNCMTVMFFFFFSGNRQKVSINIYTWWPLMTLGFSCLFILMHSSLDAMLLIIINIQVNLILDNKHWFQIDTGSHLHTRV